MKAARGIGISILTLVGLIVLGKGVQPPVEEKTVKKDENILNVASYNIDSKDNPNAKKIIKQMQSKNIEIAGFQEIDKNNDRNDFDMLGQFKGQEYPYVNFSKGRDFANGEFGIGTISNIPLTEISTIPIDSSGGFATKTLERSIINKNNKQIAVYNTHLSFESTELRKRQLFEIVKRVNEDPTPYKIILGDFNTDSNIYEYSMFFNDFKMVNGNDGKWLNTFRLTDPEMKVYSLDNIIMTKNIDIEDSGMVESHLSDHNMLFASLRLNDEKKVEKKQKNIALGQKIVASSTYEKANQASYLSEMAVDNNDETQWESQINKNEDDKESLIMELDDYYNIDDINLLWGDNFPIDFDILTSKDGKNYSLTKNIYSNSERKIKVNKSIQDVKFIKLELNKKMPTDSLRYRGYMLKEWQIKGEPADKKLDVDTFQNLLDVDKLKKSILETSKNINVSFNEKLFKVKNKGIQDEKAQIIIKDIAVKDMMNYRLSFDNKFEGKDTNSISMEILPKDSLGNVIMSNYAMVTDILKNDNEKHHYEYNIHTQSGIEKMDILFNILGGKDAGNAFLENFSMKLEVPINKLSIKLSSEGKIATTAQADVQSNIADSEAVDWISNNPKVLEVNKKGKVSFKEAGKATLKAILKKDPRYTVSKEIEVKK